MDIVQINEFKPFETILSHIFTVYLAQLYCVCILWTKTDFDQIVAIKNGQSENQFPSMIWLNYENDSNIDDIVRGGIEIGYQAFVATPNSTLNFLDSYDIVRFDAKTRFHLMHVIVLPSENMPTESILNHPAVRDLPNILLIVPSNDLGSFDLITSRFVGQNDGASPVILDTFDGPKKSFIHNSNFFPDKLSNLQQRTIRIAIFNYEPYSFWKFVEPGSGNANSVYSDEERSLFIDGTEALILLEYCASYNCSLTVTHDDAAEWGVLYENKTGDGLLGAVVERRADVGFTALSTWYEEFQHLDFSFSITRAGVTCVCPKPRLISGLLLPMLPFNSTMWIVSGFTFICIFSTIYFIRKLTIHMYGESSIDDTSVDSVWFQLIAFFLSQSPEMQKLVKLFRSIPVEQLAARITTRDFRFIIERLPYGHYAAGEYIDENALKYLQVMHEDVYFAYCVAWTYKTWPFKSNFDLFILRVIESGIQKFWELKAVNKVGKAKVQLGIATSRLQANNPVKLKIESISGILALWLLGTVLAAISFIVEIIWHKILSKRKLTRLPRRR